MTTVKVSLVQLPFRREGVQLKKFFGPLKFLQEPVCQSWQHSNIKVVFFEIQSLQTHSLERILWLNVVILSAFSIISVVVLVGPKKNENFALSTFRYLTF